MRPYAIGKGWSISVMWRNNEFDTVFGFDSENEAIDWIKNESKEWVRNQRGKIT